GHFNQNRTHSEGLFYWRYRLDANSLQSARAAPGPFRCPADHLPVQIRRIQPQLHEITLGPGQEGTFRFCHDGVPPAHGTHC
ncbi:MAG TPA: hypothetical protein VKO87_12985, partial [Gemmatimonadaceae bacterium]|nr:hypothetical protein [Gemmatimonadaceae bacterium]